MNIPTYVINLPESTDRLAKFMTQKDIIKGNIHVIEAINGKKLRSDEIQNNTTKICNAFCTKGMIGCWMSHRKTWQTIVDNNESYAVVMEDDCKVSDDYAETLQNIINEINEKNLDIDFCYLGCFGSCSYKTPDSLFTKIQTQFLSKINNQNYILDTMFVPKAPVGFQCYLLSNKGARKLLKYLNKVEYHVDVSFLRVSKYFNVYASKNKIGLQESTANNSILTGSSFPNLLNSLLDSFGIMDENKISYSYYLSTPLAEFLGTHITVYTIILLLLLLIPRGFALVSFLKFVELSLERELNAKSIPWVVITIFGYTLKYYKMI